MLNLFEFPWLLAMLEAKIRALAPEAVLDASERDALWGAVQSWPNTEQAAGVAATVDHGQMV